MVAEHRILAVVSHGHLVQEVVGALVRHNDLHEHLRVHRVLALLGILFVREEGLGTVDDLRAFNEEDLLAIAFLEAQVITREGHTVVEEREVIDVHVLVVIPFHGLEGIDESCVRMSEVTEVSTDVRAYNSHVVLGLEALTKGNVVVKNRADRAEAEEKLAVIGSEVERLGIHLDFKLVVCATEVASEVIVFGNDFELCLDVSLPESELSAHVLEGTFEFGVRDVAACASAEHGDFERFHVRTACRSIDIFFGFFVRNLVDGPRVSFFAKREEERIGRIASAEHGNLELLQVGIQVCDNLFKRSIFVQEDEEFHKAL